MPSSWLEPATKAVTYAAVLGAVGACTLRWSLINQVGRGAKASLLPPVERLAAATLLAAAALAMSGLALRLVAHTIDVFGIPDAWSWKSISTIGLASRWGGGWRVQVFAALGLLIGALWARMHPRSGWLFAALAAVALCFSLPFTGHAEGQPLRVLLHGAHVLSAGVWAGTLTLLVFVGRSHRARGAQADLMHAFAQTAAAGVALLVVTGGVATWMYLGPLSNLWLTRYGQLLALKLSMVAAALALGANNWRHVHRTESREARRRLVLFEVVLVAIVIVITAFLTETGHPL